MTITSKNPRQLSNIEFFLRTNENATYESLLDGDVQVIRYSPKGAYPVAVIFKDKKKDPVAHYRYNTNEDREKGIDRQIQLSLSNKKYKEERKLKAKQLADIKVGDIVYTSWGYEQTNISFYLVVGLVGKATAEYVKIGSKQVEQTSWCSADVSPDLSYKSEIVERGRITQYGIKIGREYTSKTSIDSKHHSSWGY